MITLTLGCSNSLCNSTIPLPFTLNSIFPNIENRCAVCSQGVLIITKIDQEAPAFATTAAVVEALPPVALKMNQSKGGNDIFTAFQNRLAPLVFIVQLIDELSGRTGEVELVTLVDVFKERSGFLKKHLSDRLEQPLGVTRGQRLSDGFPKPSLEKPGPMNITLRNYIGCDETRILIGRGLIQEYGLVEIIGDKKLKLTKKAKPLLELPNVAEMIRTTHQLKAFQSNPILPKYYDETFAFKLAHVVKGLAPDQHDWMMHILGEIIASDSEEGWDSNRYAANETNLASQGKGHARWKLTEHMYATLYEKFRAQAERKGHEVPETQAWSRHENHVNGKLGSVLSHLKELGFIVPVAVGNTKNFAATGRGHRYQSSATGEVVE